MWHEGAVAKWSNALASGASPSGSRVRSPSASIFFAFLLPSNRFNHYQQRTALIFANCYSPSLCASGSECHNAAQSGCKMRGHALHRLPAGWPTKLSPISSSSSRPSPTQAASKHSQHTLPTPPNQHCVPSFSRCVQNAAAYRRDERLSLAVKMLWSSDATSAR